MPTGRPNNFAADPGRVQELAKDLAENRTSPVALVKRYLDRIAVVDGDLHPRVVA